MTVGTETKIHPMKRGCLAIVTPLRTNDANDTGVREASAIQQINRWGPARDGLQRWT